MGGHKLIVITGPTAAGKSALGALLAKTVGGEVVSADSMQIYKYMDIGTAKPTEAEMLGVRHHMLSVVPPWEDYSVARYVSDAARCIDDILTRGRLPVLVGGTGLYIDSLLSNRDFAVRGDAALRSELEAEYDSIGGEEMLFWLSGIDPESAASLHANDKKRIVRAFEVVKTTGKTISQHNLETQSLPPRYDAAIYALTFAERPRLYASIDARVGRMLAAGLEGEVRRLLGMGVPPGCTAMQAIGYRQMSRVISGEYDEGVAAGDIRRESRRYAKRQLTWLRRGAGVNWITWADEPDISGGARRIVNEVQI